MSSALSFLLKSIKPSLLFRNNFQFNRHSSHLLSDFQKSSLSKSITVPFIRVPLSNTQQALKFFANDVIQISSMKTVIKDENNNANRIIILGEHLGNKETMLENLSELKRQRVLNFIQTSNWSIGECVIDLNWNHFSVSEILQKLLPLGIEVPKGFEVVGDIAHMNLNKELLPYKNLIGQIILLKNQPNINTVVNKLTSIQSQFRTYQYEVIAGINHSSHEVIVYESNIKFKFIFGQVYWNSKLQNEHLRIIKQFKQNDIICDLFAGIGPFSLPATKYIKNIKVFANDLNPYCYQALKSNINFNHIHQCFTMKHMIEKQYHKNRMNLSNFEKKKLKKKFKTNHLLLEKEEEDDGIIHVSNLDARCFVSELIDNNIIPNHIIMNLPANAVDFLSCFHEWRKKVSLNNMLIFTNHNEEESEEVRNYYYSPSIRVHCYCFSDSKDPLKEAVQQVEAGLGLSSEIALDHWPVDGGGGAVVSFLRHVELVRSVSANKHMVCVSFDLPPIESIE